MSLRVFQNNKALKPSSVCSYEPQEFKSIPKQQSSQTTEREDSARSEFKSIPKQQSSQTHYIDLLQHNQFKSIPKQQSSQT